MEKITFIHYKIDKFKYIAILLVEVETFDLKFLTKDFVLCIRVTCYL